MKIVIDSETEGLVTYRITDVVGVTLKGPFTHDFQPHETRLGVREFLYQVLLRESLRLATTELSLNLIA